MKGYGGVEVQVHSLVTSALHRSGQLEDLTALFLEKGHSLHTEEQDGWASGPVWTQRRVENLKPTSGIEPQFIGGLTRSLVTCWEQQ
jgi:hypothetical protein